MRVPAPVCVPGMTSTPGAREVSRSATLETAEVSTSGGLYLGDRIAHLHATLLPSRGHDDRVQGSGRRAAQS